MHSNTVHQLVLIGELLIVELLAQVVHLIIVKNGQPICWFLRSRPFDTVSSAGGNVHKIAGLQFDRIIFELKSRCTLQNTNPFMFILVVPETLWRKNAPGRQSVLFGC